MKRPILLTISLLISSLHWSGVPKAPDIVVGEYSHISGTNERPKSVYQPLACNNMIAMNDTILTAVRKHRDSAFNTCLTCQGSSCSFRAFQDRKTEAVCKRLFCTPIFVSPGFETPADTPSGKSSFTYSYDISKEGSLKNIAIIKAEGVFSKSDAKKFIKARTRKTKFEPINFDNKSYEIINLTGEMSLNTRWEDRD
tara:strand:- start:41 stop:631 length:591 start_codon:yes stop_codon:yes gene_type:complete